MTPTRPALLVVNAHSRRGGPDVVLVVTRELEQAGVPVLHRSYDTASALPNLIRGMADMEVRARRPRSVNTDGEITTRTPARFRMLPGALEVYVP